MRCPECGRFMAAGRPCSRCWTLIGRVIIHDPGDQTKVPWPFDRPPLWKRLLRLPFKVIFWEGL